MENVDYGPAFLSLAWRSWHLNKSFKLNEHLGSHWWEADNYKTLFGLLSSAKATSTVCRGRGEDACYLAHPSTNERRAMRDKRPCVFGINIPGRFTRSGSSARLEALFHYHNDLEKAFALAFCLLCLLPPVFSLPLSGSSPLPRNVIIIWVPASGSTFRRSQNKADEKNLIKVDF